MVKHDLIKNGVPELYKVIEPILPVGYELTDLDQYLIILKLDKNTKTPIKYIDIFGGNYDSYVLKDDIKLVNSYECDEYWNKLGLDNPNDIIVFLTGIDNIGFLAKDNKSIIKLYSKNNISKNAYDMLKNMINQGILII